MCCSQVVRRNAHRYTVWEYNYFWAQNHLVMVRLLYCNQCGLKPKFLEVKALTSGFFLKPNATFDDYLADVVPLFAGFISILGVSEVCFLYLLIKLSHTYLMLLYESYVQNYCGFNWYFQFILFAWLNN